MAKRDDVLDALLDHYDRVIAEAFAEAIDALKRGADLATIIAALSRGDIPAALEAMHLDEAAFNKLAATIEAAYVDGGETSAAYFPQSVDESGANLVIRFNVRNPRAEAWIRNESSRLVTSILDDQRESIRVALDAGLQKGDNPTTTALDIVGRIDRSTGKRSGGIIGLTGQQSQFVVNARAELASAKAGDLNHYLTRKLRDKRLDRTIKKAIAAGEAPPAEIAKKAIRAYENRLLKYRGDSVGRTESLTALRAGENETFRQAIDRGDVDVNTLVKAWDSAGDRKVRHTHAVLDGDTVTFFEPFKSPSGALMMFPGDTSLGAGAEEIVFCRCRAKYRIDFFANLRNAA